MNTGFVLNFLSLGSLHRTLTRVGMHGPGGLDSQGGWRAGKQLGVKKEKYNINISIEIEADTFSTQNRLSSKMIYMLFTVVIPYSISTLCRIIMHCELWCHIHCTQGNNIETIYNHMMYIVYIRRI